METLTLEQMYYIGELVTAIVVIISLIYLALQLRASNQIATITALASFSPRYENSFELLTRPENAKLYLAATDGYEDLDEEQKLRFRSFIVQCASVMEDYYLMSLGGVRVAEIEGRDTMIQLILKTPGGRAAWHDTRILLDPGFREIIDVVAEAKGEKRISV